MFTLSQEHKNEADAVCMNSFEMTPVNIHDVSASGSDLSCRLNEPIIKKAYLEFMKNYKENVEDVDLDALSPIDGSRAVTSTQKTNISDSESLSLSQEQLNDSRIKEAYVKFMLNSIEDFSLSKREKGKCGRSTKKSNMKNKCAKKQNNQEEGPNKKIIKHWHKLQNYRNVGLYALCDNCDKARYLPNVKDPLDLPEQWYCYMNPNKNYNKCEDPEEKRKDEKLLIDNKFNAGSIVWAMMEEFTWWPAMVDDDPNLEDYYFLKRNSNTPIKYHVTFFYSCEVPRAWLYTNDIKSFKTEINNPNFHPLTTSKYKPQIDIAIELAKDAMNLTLIQRLRKYSFVTRSVKICKKQLVKHIKSEERASNLNKLENNNKKKSLKRYDSIKSNVSENFSKILNEINSSIESMDFSFQDI